MRKRCRFGGCLCGEVRYEFSGEPEAVSICHCTSCRRAVGATPVAWVISRVEDFSIEGETLSSYRSSPGVERTFCGVCGASLTFSEEDSPGSVDVALATFDEPEIFIPERHIWLEDGEIHIPEGLPRHIRGPQAD